MFAVCTLTSATGATSLLTVPLMIQFGIEPRAAIATNMALLVAMNFGSDYISKASICNSRISP